MKNKVLEEQIAKRISVGFDTVPYSLVKTLISELEAAEEKADDTASKVLTMDKELLHDICNLNKLLSERDELVNLIGCSAIAIATSELERLYTLEKEIKVLIEEEKGKRHGRE